MHEFRSWCVGASSTPFVKLALSSASILSSSPLHARGGVSFRCRRRCASIQAPSTLAWSSLRGPSWRPTTRAATSDAAPVYVSSTSSRLERRRLCPSTPRGALASDAKAWARLRKPGVLPFCRLYGRAQRGGVVRRRVAAVHPDLRERASDESMRGATRPLHPPLSCRRAMA